VLTRVNDSIGEDRAQQVPRVLRAAVGPHWEFLADGRHFEMRHPDRGTPYRPPRRPPSWRELLNALENGLARDGAVRDACLPLRWGRETELTISAVQALDPILKEGRLHPYRSGFLPQPVVRFTGRRDAAGDLEDGFLTSFVNISRVHRIDGLDDYGAVLDGWLAVLSQLGFHARHLSMEGELSPWRRRQVEGITVRFRHLDITLGDMVLLWNTQHPDRMAVDLGTGLERLAWARTHEHWSRLIYGTFARAASPTTLDAIRTATLLLGHGITPTARGAGGITRRVISAIDRNAARLGVGALVRDTYAYWSLFSDLRAPWPEIARAMEEEMRL
jgi:hypothetical protein